MSYIALYRKFRPTTFSDILGQDHIVTTLKNQVIADRVGHAYLFSGSRGCGKTTTAKVLSRAVNCLNPKNGEPCNECAVCKAALSGALTDIVEMDAASNNGVDDIRAIRDEVNFLPTVAKYRVYIIDEVHMLSPGAFNALLKTLEEPPEHVKFILATTEPQKLPATILSRCQRFDFKKISEKDIIFELEKVCKESDIKYTDSSLRLIAELAEGGMRDALSILERCSQDGENNITDEKIKELAGIPKLEYISGLIEAIVKKDSDAILKISEEIISEGKDVENILWEMIKYTKDLMLYLSTKKASNIYSEDDVKKIEEIIKNTSKEDLINIIYELSKTENAAKFSTQRNIVFEAGLLKLCNTQKMQAVAYSEVKDIKPVEKKFEIPKSETVKPETKPIVQAKEIKVEEKQNVKPEIKLKNKSSDFWENVIASLKEAKKPMLYSNLMNTKAVKLDDMTVGISFPNGLNPFGKRVIEQPENMQELKRLVSMACGNTMNVKLLDEEPKVEANNKSFDFGMNINIIED